MHTVIINVANAQVPDGITYQGTLREGGVAITGTRNMVFKITNADGSTQYWTSGSTAIYVTRGLFSLTLSPSGVSWHSITPYIEVTVEGQLLLPRDPLLTSAYAFVAKRVEDGAITAAQIASAQITDSHVAANAQIAFSKLEKDPSISGTINLSTNPLDWTQLKSVPIGFSDGIDNLGGGQPTVEAGDVIIDAAVSNFDFLSNVFHVTSSPAGEANISLDASSVTLTGNQFNIANKLLQLNALNYVDNNLIDISSITKQGNTFNTANSLVLLDNLGALPALSAVALTDLDASNLTSGQVPSARLANAILIGTALQPGSTFFVSSGTIRSLRLEPGNTPADATAGALYYDATSGQLKLYDASGSFVTIATGTTGGGIAYVTANSSEFSGQGTAGSPLKIVASSVTMQGNAFNGPSLLLQLNSIGLISNNLIDASSITMLGATVDATELPTGIDAAKLANASVDNTEFQYLNGVSSLIQTQLDSKAIPANVIQLVSVLQSGATFYVSSGTAQSLK
ncbi:MAG: hypothetical protein AABZ44_04885, partial [Elusimicrobiota bacterium]